MPTVRTGYATGMAIAVVGCVLGVTAAAAAETAPTPTVTTASVNAPTATDPAAATPQPATPATTTTAAPAATTTTSAATTTVPAATTTAPAATTTAPAVTGTTSAPTEATTTAGDTTAGEQVPATLAAAPAPPAGCPPVGAVGILRPHSRPLALSASRTLAAAEIAYPSDGSVFTADALDLGRSCTVSHPIAGTAELRSVSLFGGVVTARSVTLSLTGGPASVSGLRVGGRPAQLTQGRPIRLGNWGFLLAPDPSSPSRSALEIQLSQPRAGLPAGSIVFVPFAHIELVPTPAAPPPATTTTETAPSEPGAPSPATTTAATPATPRAPHRFPGHDESFDRIPLPSDLFNPAETSPLTVTPTLEAGPYVFPVAGEVSYGDSYGGLRTDVSGGWHHGDDLFAPIGAPVVAVADGTINRVGWERLGGWRLWVRDADGDQFYYAHLSGYSLNALLDKHVHRGEVIGFVGNTGDAYTTLPHLHFEVHPRELLHLGYDGAVDPTTYLASWPRAAAAKAPVPVHPELPHARRLRLEALANFRELLAARGLAHHSKRVAAPVPVRLPVPLTVPRPAPVAAAAAVPGRRGWSSADSWIAANAAMAVAAAGLALWRRRLCAYAGGRRSG